jgi:hypothetical protein
MYRTRCGPQKQSEPHSGARWSRIWTRLHDQALLCTHRRAPEDSRPQDAEDATGTLPVLMQTPLARVEIIPLLTLPMSIPDLVSKMEKMAVAREREYSSLGEGPSVPTPPTALRQRPTRGWEMNGLERYSPPALRLTPVIDPLFKASPLIEAYTSIGSNLAPTPTTTPSPLTPPMATPLQPTTGASSSMVQIKEEPPVSKGGDVHQTAQL